jgi:sugar lactone lactonase YvrE
MAVERVASGFRWAQGPVYFPAGRYVLFSDIPNNPIMRYCEDDGHTSVFRQPSMNSNGNTIDREGRLITCEHGGRWRSENAGRAVTAQSAMAADCEHAHAMGVAMTG